MRTQPADSASAASATTGSAGTTRSGAKTILFLGTSLTAGYGINPDSAFPALIQRKLDSAKIGYLVRVAGLSGETSAGARRRIEWLLREPADVVLIETGANDGLRGLNPDSTRANIEAIIDAIRAKNRDSKIILAGMEAPPNLGADYTRRFSALFPLVAAEKDVVLIPFLLESVAGLPELNQSDGIHPNERGSVVIATTVWRTLRDEVRWRAESGERRAESGEWRADRVDRLIPDDLN